MSTLEELKAIVKDLPQEVQEDIEKRVLDWFSTGGKAEDPYIRQQLKFAKRVAEIKVKDTNRD